MKNESTVLFFPQLQTVLQRNDPAGCHLTQTREKGRREDTQRGFLGRSATGQSLRAELSLRYETFAEAAAQTALRDRDRFRWLSACGTDFPCPHLW